jgi:rod shape-determining protein MreC
LAHCDTVTSNQWLNEYQHRYDGIVGVAQVLTRLISVDNQSLILDVGSRQGIERDMVAVYKDCLVGRVVEVFPCMCRVALLTDQASAVPVWCAQTKSQGIAKGIGSNDVLELNYVNHLDALVKDDMVISHGEGLIYPKGLCIGFVQDWQLDGFFYKVAIKPAIDVEEITYCTLVAKGSSFE